MKRRNLIALLITLVSVLLIGCLVFSLLIYLNTNKEVAQENGGIGDYAPAQSSAVLLSVDEENYQVHVNLVDRENDAVNVCMFWRVPNETYWKWFVENSEPGDTVTVTHHPFTKEEISEGPIEIINICLENTE